MSISAVRAALVQNLKEGWGEDLTADPPVLSSVRVFDGPREKPVDLPAAVVLVPRDLYLVGGQTFAKEFEFRIDVALYVASDLVALDDLIETTLVTAMEDWSLSGVDGPRAVLGESQTMLEALVHLSKMITLGG